MSAWNFLNGGASVTNSLMASIGSNPQVHVAELGPTSGGPTLIMIHGGAHTRECFRTTPDGRPGWGPYFAAAGFRVLLPDWPGSGRSDTVPLDELTGELVCDALGRLLDSSSEPVILLTHSMSGAYGWKLLERRGDRIHALIAVAPAPPGNIQPTTAVTGKEQNVIEVETAGSTWAIPLDTIVPVTDLLVKNKLIGDSRRFPMQALETYAASLSGIAPQLVLERQNIEGRQLTIESTRSFRGKPILVVTGADDRDHPRGEDEKIVTWLTGVGAKAEHAYLPDFGITGNGHMLMLEDNSDAIAALILRWLTNLNPD